MASAPFAIPELRRDGDDFIFTWQSFGVGIGLTNLAEDSRRRVHATLTVTSIAPLSGDRTGLLEWGALDLHSLSGRESVCRSLRSVAAELLDWSKALRYVCWKATGDFQAARPSVDLATIQTGELSPFLFDRVYPAGEAGLLYGDGGAGKSLLGHLLAISAATGRPICGALRPTAAVRPLIIDYETTEEESAARIGAISRGLGLPHPPSVRYLRLERPVADSATEVRREVGRNQIGLVIIDSMLLACGDLLATEDIRRFFGTLRGLPPGVTKVIIHHISAEGAREEHKPASPWGLRFISNYSRSNWEIRGERSEGRLDVGMFHRKANNFGLQRPIGLSLLFADGEISVQRTDVLDSPTLVGHASVSDRIIAILREGRQDVPAIAKALGIQENQIRARLSQLAKDGDVRQIEGKRWEINGGQ